MQGKDLLVELKPIVLKTSKEEHPSKPYGFWEDVFTPDSVYERDWKDLK